MSVNDPWVFFGRGRKQRWCLRVHQLDGGKKNIPALCFTYELMWVDFALSFFFFNFLSANRAIWLRAVKIDAASHPRLGCILLACGASSSSAECMRRTGIPHAEVWKRKLSSCSRVPLNTSLLKFHIQRWICMGNFAFVGLEKEEGTLAVGAEIRSGRHHSSARSLFRITQC